jgi:hypothetical protein
MAQVFTSYSSRDTETVDTIVEKMSQAGIDVWIDRPEIEAGDRWRVQIVKAIRTSPAFVLMLSPNSAASDNVRKEIDLSQNYERKLFPLMLQKVRPLPDEISYQLAGEQIIDVERFGFDEAVDRLIETLKDFLRKVEQTEEPATQQVELVIQGIDPKSFTADMQAQFLDFLAQKTGADRSQLQIAKVTAGSVHVFVDMPTLAAYELLTLALNRDVRFKQMGITSLRLDGDAKYVNTSSGALTLAATMSPLVALWLKIPALFTPMLTVPIGKMLTLLLGAIFIAGASLTLSGRLFQGAVPQPTDTPTPFSTPTPPASETPTATQVPTSTATEIPTTTQTATATATPTLSLTPVPTYLTLRGQPMRTIACNYGPGDIYLYQEVMNPRYQMDVFGKAVIRYRGREQTWLYTQADGFQLKCFVNADDVQLTGGGIEDLKTVYPGEVTLPVSDLWDPPQNVVATRQGDRVMISWDFLDLPDGEREREDDSKPRYLLELWLCQGGELAFTPTGSWDTSLPRSSISVTDEAGCAEPSHGVIYLAEKHGYVGPVEIKWPPHPVPTP